MKIRTLAVSVALGLLLLASASSVAHSGEAGDVVYDYLEENGFERDDVRVVSAGFSVNWCWNWNSYLRFTSKSQPEQGEMFVELRKPSPLSGWHLARFEQSGK